MHARDEHITQAFEGLVVRKDLVKLVKGNAIVPSYVLEYLLGQYCATRDEDSIQTGIQTVKDILQKHYVHRNEANLIKSNIREAGRYKVIDKISVTLNDKNDVYEAKFSNLGISKVIIDTGTIKAHPKLLVGGVWCICEVGYEPSEDNSVNAWVMQSLKPIQMSFTNFEDYAKTRATFDTEQWIDLLIQSIGLNPDSLGRRSKLIQLMRLVPFCERNYNLIELGPKGTGKSHIFSEFSPHGILISGGEVTVPKLFVNNASGKIGLVGYWDVVAFDEFAGRKKTVNKALVDIMKNYMANKSFSRGVETLGAEASMVFIGNTKHNVAYMLKHSDLFEELPEKYHDSAFLDRMHFYVPGWEVDIIRSDMFSSGYGFVVDYLAEILRYLRKQDFSSDYLKHFTLLGDISTRDRDAITKTFSGLMKVIYPHQEASADEIEELLIFAIEGRKRVKDQLLRIDKTYADVDFGYKTETGEVRRVKTLEEKQYPQFYHQSAPSADEPASPESAANETPSVPIMSVTSSSEAATGHTTYEENQTGVDFKSLFGPYIKGANRIEIYDPYIRAFHQVRNVMELLELALDEKEDSEPLEIQLTTAKCDFNPEKQAEFLQSLKGSAQSAGVEFDWNFDDTLHARSLVTDTGWKISLDRGLDIFQRYEMNDSFALANRLQKQRSVKRFEITYLKV